MIDPRTKLDVLHDADGSFTDFTDSACDFSRDAFSVTLDSSTDYLYVGFTKPINAFYVELETPNTNANTLTLERYNGSSWVELIANDETKGFTRSGFVTWSRPMAHYSTEINGKSRYWYRLRPSVTHSETLVRGLNLVFCDDNSLKQEFYEITNSSLLPSGQSSHIMSHVSARNHIIQELRNAGFIKINATTGQENLNQWDLLDIFEVREAAKFLALSKIFFNLSDEIDDNWFKKHVEYSDKYSTTIKAVRLSLDTDDDGEEDSNEKLSTVKVTRFRY